jgi:hypothetical protein
VIAIQICDPNKQYIIHQLLQELKIGYNREIQQETQTQSQDALILLHNFHIRGLIEQFSQVHITVHA